MDPPRLLHACILFQGGVLVTGGKVIKNIAISQRTVWYFFVDVNKQIQYKKNIARSSKVSDGPGGKLVDFAGTHLLDFNSGRWEHQY